MQIRSTHDLADRSAEALVDAVPVEMGHLLEQLTPTLKSEAPIEGTVQLLQPMGRPLTLPRHVHDRLFSCRLRPAFAQVGGQGR